MLPPGLVALPTATPTATGALPPARTSLPWDSDAGSGARVGPKQPLPLAGRADHNVALPHLGLLQLPLGLPLPARRASRTRARGGEVGTRVGLDLRARTCGRAQCWRMGRRAGAAVAAVGVGLRGGGCRRGEGVGGRGAAGREGGCQWLSRGVGGGACECRQEELVEACGDG